MGKFSNRVSSEAPRFCGGFTIKNQGSNRIGILISGNGSTMQALLNCAEISGKVSVVISSKASAFGILRAKRAGIPCEILPEELTGRDKKTEAERWILGRLNHYGVSKVFLSGFMRIVSSEFIEKIGLENIFNIHPSMLPKYRGTHGFEETLQSGDTMGGVSVHQVSSEVDLGRLVLQREYPIPEHREFFKCRLWLSINEQRVIQESIRRIQWHDQLM